MQISTVDDWLARYIDGGASPDTTLEALRASLDDDPAWIHRVDARALSAQLEALAERLARVDGDLARLPLYGVPFAVKDNIDVAGLPTTAACPEFAYTPDTSAFAVQRLQDAGAILMGKTNMDQFATGLVGTRSPYGAVPNTFDPRYVSGGSSSGSASVVARGLVAFSLGTDTAGSGRVPAGFNNIVGVKSTCGAISTRGVVPACRTLDCVSIFALDMGDAQTVQNVLTAFDSGDAYSRGAPPPQQSPASDAAIRLGVPTDPEFFGDKQARKAFDSSLQAWRELGATLVPVDFSPLQDVATLLYQGPWVAERYAAVGAFIEAHPDAVDPTVAEIIGRGRHMTAADGFRAQYRLAELRRHADRLMADVDALLVPTSPSIYTIEAVQADPVTLNSRLGTYTNFVNLLDQCALALPGGFRDDGLPSGITLIGPTWADQCLNQLGRRWQAATRWPLGISDQKTRAPARTATGEPGPDCVRLAVVGAHLRGMPLNHQLTERNAQFIEATHTADHYRLLALAGTVPPKPGLIRAATGASIEVELWDVPMAAFGSFVALIPAPLGIGTLTLADGREVKSFICEGWAVDTARDITDFGGWRAFMAAPDSETA